MNETIIINEYYDNRTEIVRELISEFLVLYNQEKKSIFNTTVKIPLDFNNEVKNLYPYSEMQFNFSNQFDYNGIIGLADKTKFGHFTVILQQSIFSNYQIYSTLFHELTHVVDFYYYYNKFQSILEDNSLKNKMDCFFYEFYFWTEFNAKFKGLIRFNEELSKTGRSIDYSNSAKNFQDGLKNSIKNHKSIYSTVHFYARLNLILRQGSTFSQLDPEIYPRNEITSFWNYAIEDLILILISTKDFNDFLNNKNKIRTILNSMTPEYYT